ncbi:MAG: SLC13 family permease [Desulfobacter sp.]|nr:MAG: SLC13 family permease [Desulfobacter sp.]
MQRFKWAFPVIGAMILAVFIVTPGDSFFSPRPSMARAASGPTPSPAEKKGSAYGSRAPRHIVIEMPLLTPLITGETGTFEISAHLRRNTAPGPPSVGWTPNKAAPLMGWLAAPENSGIEFLDKTHPERPRRHIMIKFAPSPANQPLTATVQYHVNKHTSAGHYKFWMEIYGQLTRGDGTQFQDTGAIRLPVEIDTHLNTKLLMLLVIGIAVLLFIMEWVRVDVVAMAMMVLLPELGLLNARDTFKGISSNAVMAIIGVMIISYGLNRAGLVSRMIQPLLKLVGKSPKRLTIIFSGLIAVISSVMQNTGAAVLFLPGIRMAASYRLKIPISRVLMPIGMAAILGGTLTMIGTSPLILLNDILPEGMPKFGLLELTPIGLSLVAGGIAYLSTAGLGFLSRRPLEKVSNTSGTDNGNGENGILDAYPMIRGPFEISVPDDFEPGQLPLTVTGIRRRFMVNIVAASKSAGACEIAPLPEHRIRPGYTLCVYGPKASVKKFVKDYRLLLKKEPECFKANMFNPSMAGIVEGVVSPRSVLIGQTIKQIRFRETFGVNPLAIHQSGKTYYQELADRPLQAGDAVLVHGTWEQFHALEELHQNLIIITPFEEEFHKPENSGRAMLCFGTSLFLMLLSSFYFQNRPYNPIPLSVCLMLGAVGMVISKVITINEAYRAVDWRTVFLLGGLIPLGMAVDQTGTAEWIAKSIVTGMGPSMSPLLLLILLAVLSCAFTTVISNVGACTLLVPLGVSIASQIGVDPRVAAIVVGIGVSNSFILPTHQVNALYMGPGEYRTRDYIKIGGILAVIYIAILVTVTWAFYL